MKTILIPDFKDPRLSILCVVPEPMEILPSSNWYWWMLLVVGAPLWLGWVMLFYGYHFVVALAAELRE